ncbi:MAG TPA: hypothetical protein VJ875_03075 [Pyrinomonadaceae bacterium]|nr:hypothetical protein [Pyrinomonadaceae bacterium]
MTLSAVLFDSSSLRNHRNLFALVHPAYRHFVGPKTVQVLREADSQVYHSFVEALEARRIDNLGADASKVDPPAAASLEHSDILGHASLLSKNSDFARVLIVSDDPALEQLAKERQITCVTSAAYPGEIQATIDAEKQTAVKLAVAAAEEARRNRAALIWQSLVGLALVGLALLVWRYRFNLVSKVPIWGTVLGLTAAGPLLYALRGRQRLMYGVAETGIGLYSALSTVAPFVWAHVLVQPVFSPTSGITIVGGLYVMVRGLDNIGTGLKGTTWESSWKYFSGEHDRNESATTTAE